MKLQKLSKQKTLRIRLSEDEWQYLKQQKAKGISYNTTIRQALLQKVKIKIPF